MWIRFSWFYRAARELTAERVLYCVDCSERFRRQGSQKRIVNRFLLLSFIYPFGELF